MKAIKMPPKSKRLQEGSNERTETFYGVQLARSKGVLEWPYKTPSPEFMGKSGFYFTPTKKFKDRVTCFYCRKTQSNWKDVKDPTSYHLEISHECSFSKLLHLSKERSSNPEFDWSNVQIFKDPMSQEAIDIRQETFGKSWPHDKVDGSNPTSKNMVNAGFYYSPLDSNDDLAICVYCGVSLEGWEYDDDPLFEHQKRSEECYFLNHLKGSSQSRKSLKRTSSTPAVDESSFTKEENNTKTKEDENEQALSLGRSRRVQRKRRVIKELSPEDSILDDGEDESFGITGHDDELDDDDYVEASNEKRPEILSVKKSPQPKTSASPFKKSKILDSSFDNDMFSKDNTNKLEIPPVSKLLSQSPERKPVRDENLDLNQLSFRDPARKTRPTQQKPVLTDITNVSRGVSNSPKKSTLSDHPDLDEENSIILISNSKEFIEQDLSLVNGKSESAKSTINLSVTQKEHINNETSNKAPSETNGNLEEDKSNLAVQKSSMEIGNHNYTSSAQNQAGDNSIKEPSPDSQSSEVESKSGNKSILQSISRFFKSPQLHRSRSPFLDASYRGSDHIQEVVPLIGPNDTPIEESTDHHIQVEPAPRAEEVIATSPDKSLTLKSNKHILREVDLSHKLEVDVEDDSSSNYQSVEDFDFVKDRETYWKPTDTNELFDKLEPLDTARNYIKELKDLDYDLSDDIDGRISYFINEMPDNELEMTINEWISYSAQQGKKHIRGTCEKMLEQFDQECERALAKLRHLPME